MWTPYDIPSIKFNAHCCPCYGDNILPGTALFELRCFLKYIKEISFPGWFWFFLTLTLYIFVSLYNNGIFLFEK